MMNDAPIGIFDSGLGGLSVWREVIKLLPHESVMYFGDGKNCPYGDKDEELIKRYATDAVDFLVGKGAKLIVVACNTATAAAIDMLRERYRNIPIVGMEPAVKPAALSTESGVIGILATAASINGRLFHDTSARFADKVKIISAVGEGFVEIVENDMENTPLAERTVRRVIAPLIEQGADRIVLGCTHYPFLKDTIRKVIGNDDIMLIDSAPAVAKRTEFLLEQFGMRASADNRPSHDFYTAGDEAYRRRIIEKSIIARTLK